VCPAPSSVTPEDAIRTPIPFPVIWISFERVHVPAAPAPVDGTHVPTESQSPPLSVPCCPMLRESTLTVPPDAPCEIPSKLLTEFPVAVLPVNVVTSEILST
jgi:hypothetical protein